MKINIDIKKNWLSYTTIFNSVFVGVSSVFESFEELSKEYFLNNNLT